MIIVKTKNGAEFINDKFCTIIEHSKKNKSVCYLDKGIGCQTIKNVESVTFVSDAQPIEYKDEGLEIERLKAELEKEKRENHIMFEHFGFIREWFFIYQEAFDKIHDDCKRAEREHPGIYVNLAAIIEQAEKKYQESQKRFEKVREKWDKKDK